MQNTTEHPVISGNSKPSVSVEIGCDQAAPVTLSIKNLPPFYDSEIDNSLINDECFGFCLLMRGEPCITYGHEIPEDKRLVVSYILQTEHKKRNSTEKSTSIKIDFLISNTGKFRPSKFSDPRKFDDTEARLFLMNEMFFFARHLQKIFDNRHKIATVEKTTPNFLEVGMICNKGGKIYIPSSTASSKRFNLTSKRLHYNYV